MGEENPSSWPHLDADGHRCSVAAGLFAKKWTSCRWFTDEWTTSGVKWLHGAARKRSKGGLPCLVIGCWVLVDPGAGGESGNHRSSLADREDPLIHGNPAVTSTKCPKWPLSFSFSFSFSFSSLKLLNFILNKSERGCF